MNCYVEDMSYMCFGDSVKVRMSRILVIYLFIEDCIWFIDLGLLLCLKVCFKKCSELGYLKVGCVRGYF